jgi:hypothetical protein
MGDAARVRAERDFAYDGLAARLTPLARGDLSVLTSIGSGPAAPHRESPVPAPGTTLGPRPSDPPPPAP